MRDQDFNAEQAYKRLQSAKNAAERPMFGSNAAQEVKVQIFSDKSIGPAKFIANATLPGTYRAHPLTIAAMRADLFAGADSEPFADLELNIECESCSNTVDVQFWKFCPYCEKNFPRELAKSL